MDKHTDHFSPAHPEGDSASFKDELQDLYFQVFGIAAKLHLMRVPKGVDSHLFESLKPLLDDALANVDELTARLDDTDEPLGTKTSWWQSGHWMLG